ncbi:MAG: 5-oxoprolinase subunit PxpB [Robiginitalea sp.]
MNTPPFEIKTYGPDALLLEWPKKVSLKILMDILSFQEYLRKNHLTEEAWEFIPIYHSLTLIHHKGKAAMESVVKNLPTWYSACPKGRTLKTRQWELPVCYEEPFSLDLQETARNLEMTPETLVELHTGRDYRVYGIGFLPGFLYLGGIPEALRIPRRKQPRIKVPKGSVGLAGEQTGVYPQESPGGWHIIGNCPVPLFDAGKKPPCLISPGDQIRFRSVSKGEYELHKLEGEVGIYNYKKGNGNAKGA